MADDRPVEDTTDQVARLQRELDDLKSTVFARLSRKSTGDMEITLRPTPKEGTIFLRGQTLNRADYPDLWQWVTANNVIIEDAFGPGNGTTTFTVPDWQGRVPISAGTIDQGALETGGGGVETYYIGRSGGLTHRFISAAVMPKHRHTGTTGMSDRTHYHGGQTDSDAGGHSGHWGSGGRWAAQDGGTPGTAAQNSADAVGNHSHHFTSATENTGHLHGFTSDYAGGDATYSPGSFPLDLRIPYLTVNWMLWT